VAYRVKSTGRWAAQGHDRGKRVQLGTFATKREALAREAEHKCAAPSADMTVSQWRSTWLTNATWADSTRAHNAERTKQFAEQHGRKQMSAINRTVARDYVAVHPSALGALSAMFGAAMYEDDRYGRALLDFNPFSRLVRRTTRRRDLRSEWLTMNDVDNLTIVATLQVGQWAADMITFAAETGIRPGELFVIGHEDLKQADGIAVIRQAADSKTRRIKAPKNNQAREVVLSHAAAEAAARNGTEGRVFSTPRGTQFWNASWSYYWHQIRAAAGRPTMDFYELRHLCATRLLEAGLSERDVAVQLGHTDGGELVRKVYGHPSERQALVRVREALNGEQA
jgi:integrase